MDTEQNRASTERENEYEYPGGNYPDQGGVDPAAAQEQAAASPTETDPAVESTEEPPAPAAAEPSHVAEGIGVIDGEHHHGQDGGRETVSASGAQQTPGGLGTEQEQRLPAMSQNDASDIDKIAGIVAQTRSDIATEGLDEVVRVLEQRLEQAGLSLPHEEVVELGRQITTGDAAAPEGSAEPAAS